jgi:hypothetical protein
MVREEHSYRLAITLYLGSLHESLGRQHDEWGEKAGRKTAEEEEENPSRVSKSK